MAKKTVVLVYSGGLDTSICIPMMREDYGYDHVVTVTIDVGQPEEDILDAAKKAQAMGTEHYTVDAKEEFARDYWLCLAEGQRGLPGLSDLDPRSARPLITGVKAAQVAQKLGATAVPSPTAVHRWARGMTSSASSTRSGPRSLKPSIHAPDPREESDPQLGNLSTRRRTTYRFNKASPRSGASTRTSGAVRSRAALKLEEPDFTPPEEIFRWTKGPESVARATCRDLALDFRGRRLSPSMARRWARKARF